MEWNYEPGNWQEWSEEYVEGVDDEMDKTQGALSQSI